jgi:2-aminobenzoate-CoA ligase
VALLGFPAGTTGEPAGTMHLHRDLLIIADGYAKEVLGVTPTMSSAGAAGVHVGLGPGYLPVASRHGDPARERLARHMIEIIETYKATISFTSPTAYQRWRDGQGREPGLAASRGVGWRDAARTRVRGMDLEDWQADPRWHRLN